MPHIPVLLNEVIDSFSYLRNSGAGYFVYGTLGNAGHSVSIVKNLIRQLADKNKNDKSKLKIIAIDKDMTAIKLSEKLLKTNNMYDDFILIHGDYKNIKEILDEELKPHPTSPYKGEGLINGALLDLGVSSMQFDNKERGFSFSDPDQLLDMRMDQTQKLNAATILNYYSEKQIERILKDYGEERYAKYIARKIMMIRKNHRFETVGDLLFALKDAIPKKIQQTSRIHYATKTFQALRIEVNNELEFLSVALEDFISLLTPGSRLAVISFHSLEDRIVKNTFRKLAKDCICPKESPVCNCNHQAVVKIVTRHPITATEKEIKANPRSRSAKLRIVEKLAK